MGKEKEELLYESSVDIETLNEEQEVILDEEDVYFSNDLKVVASENPYVLGKLVGTFMVSEEDNGNGRLYPTETIKTRVVDLPYTKRMIANKSLLGECHHPMGERTNIWMDESCISTVKLEMRGNKLYGEADILDTPKGRIVNTLARYGTNIGVSARATGKGTKRGGHLVITPDKYFFKTFDAVLNPGFEQARPKKLEPNGAPMQVYEENDNTITLYEEIKSQIENNKCSKEMLQYYINYTEDDSLKELNKLFEDVTTDNTLENIGEEDMEELENLRKQVEELTEENSNLKTQMQNLNAELSSYNEEKEQLVERMNFLNEESNNYQSAAESQVEELLDVLSQKEDEIDSLSEEVSRLNNDLESLRYSYAGLSSRLLHMNEEKKENLNEVSTLKEQVSKLEEDLNEEIESHKVEPKEGTRDRILPKEVNLFEESATTVNEETKDSVDISISERQVNLIRLVGGK